MKLEAFVTALVVALLSPSCKTPSTAARAAEPQARAALTSPLAPGSAAVRNEPPPSGILLDAPFPPIVRHELSNGFELYVVERHALPLIVIKLVIRAVSASDADKPGLASLSAELLKAGGAGRYSGRELAERLAALGAKLEVSASPDTTSLSLSVTSADFEPALELLGLTATKPRFDAVAFRKLQKRQSERVARLSRTSGAWAASMVLHRELYELPVGVHPYAHYDATESEFSRLTLGDCKRWQKAALRAKNAFLVVAGDVSAERAKTIVERAFAELGSEAPEPSAYPTPLAPERVDVWVVDRPGSPESSIYLATLGAELQNEDFTPLRALVEILNDRSGRLAARPGGTRSPASAARAWLEEPRYGPAPLLSYAESNTQNTPQAVAELLDRFERLAKNPPGERELADAVRQLSDGFLVESASLGAISELTARLGVHELDERWYDDFRDDVRKLNLELLKAVALRRFRAGRGLIVVAGDAARIAEPLRRFGRVSVVDPSSDFVTRRRLSHDPSVPLGALTR